MTVSRPTKHYGAGFAKLVVCHASLVESRMLVLRVGHSLDVPVADNPGNVPPRMVVQVYVDVTAICDVQPQPPESREWFPFHIKRAVWPVYRADLEIARVVCFPE